jgi:hypothetical protein
MVENVRPSICVRATEARNRVLGWVHILDPMYFTDERRDFLINCTLLTGHDPKN